MQNINGMNMNNHTNPNMGGMGNMNNGMGNMNNGMGNMNNGMGNMNNGMGNMNNGMGNMNNGMGNGMGNGLYVPKSEGTSIASIIQNKKQGNGNYSNHQNHGQNPPNQNRGQPNPYGYGIDNNGYPVSDPPRNGYSARPQDSRRDPRDLSLRRDPRSGPQSDTNSEYERIMELANDVNNSLEALEKSEKRTGRSISRDSESDTDSVDSIRSNASNRSDRSNSSTSSKASIEHSHDDQEDEEEIDNSDVVEETVKNDMMGGYGMFIIEPLLLLTVYVIMSQSFVINFASLYIDQLNPSDDGTISLTGVIIYGIIIVIMFMALRKVIEMKIEN